MRDLLEIRNKLKEKKPGFLKQDAHKKDKLKNNWRRPRGRHSKMRLKYRGYRKSPCIGYSSPKKTKELNKEGFKEIIIKNIKDLEQIKDEIVIIAGSIGINKKMKILGIIKERGLKIGNVKNIEEYIKKVKEEREKRVKKKEKKIEKKKEEKARERPKEEEEEKEDKKKEEEKIKKKVLESRNTK